MLVLACLDFRKKVTTPSHFAHCRTVCSNASDFFAVTEIQYKTFKYQKKKKAISSKSCLHQSLGHHSRKISNRNMFKFSNLIYAKRKLIFGMGLLAKGQLSDKALFV